MAVRPSKIVRLTDEIDAESWVSDKTFEQSLILGPAVVAPTEGTRFIRCAFVGPPDSMLIEIPTGRQVQGIVGLRNVAFTDCVFQDVAFLGTAETMASLRAAMGPEQAMEASPPHELVAAPPAPAAVAPAAAAPAAQRL
jgi:hypothetical protein